MKTNLKHILTVLLISIMLAGTVFANTKTSEHDMTGHQKASQDRIGDLIHESEVDGYMLAYHFMDLRDLKTDAKEKKKMDSTHDMAETEIEKPHHLMVYIMDKNHTPILKGKVGFLIKDASGKDQKAMGMFMSNGFGTTADMKKKGTYKITTKALLGNKKLMDSFNYEIN